MAFVGIEIGGTKLQSAIIGHDGCILLRTSDLVDASAGADTMRETLAAQLAWLVAAWRDRDGQNIEAVGIGFGGPVDRVRGVIATSFHVAGWNGFPLMDWVAGQLGGLPTVLENDANAAALAEATVGAGRDARLVFYSNSGSGIGAGFVIDGVLYRGRGSGEMELGHLRLGTDGGILEDAASGWSIDRRVRDDVASHPNGVMATLAAGQLADARILPASLAAHDAAAATILNDAARQYALALSHVVHLLNPEVIVLGGGVAEIGTAWRDLVSGHLETFLMAPFTPGPSVRLAALGQNVVLVGAALAAAGIARSRRPAIG